MIGWGKIVAGVVGIINTLTAIFRDEKLMKAGEDRANASMSKEQADKMRRANSARIAADDELYVDPWDKANDGR